jgi:hypothetical protein
MRRSLTVSGEPLHLWHLEPCIIRSHTIDDSGHIEHHHSLSTKSANLPWRGNFMHGVHEMFAGWTLVYYQPPTTGVDPEAMPNTSVMRMEERNEAAHSLLRVKAERHMV